MRSLGRKPVVSLLFIVVVFSLFSPAVWAEISYSSLRKIESRGLVFSRGVYSDQIEPLYEFFINRGEDLKPSYEYGYELERLVKDFQRENSLLVDGLVGEESLKFINREILDRGYKLGLRVAETDYEGELIVINKSSNTLYYFKDGQLEESFPVATGKNLGTTPSGRHYVKARIVDPWYAGRIPGGAPNNPLGRRWIGLNYGGGSLYGIHGNSDSGSIGRNISKGCIRMFNEDVEYFYELIEMDTPVWIGSQEELEAYGLEFTRQYGSLNINRIWNIWRNNIATIN